MSNEEILIVASAVSGFSVEKLRNNSQVTAFGQALIAAHDAKLAKQKIEFDRWIQALER